jgi:hypothetical protein
MYQVQVILRPTVSWPVCLGVGPPSQVEGRPPWQVDGSAIYACNSLSLSGPSPQNSWPHLIVSFKTIFYYLIRDSPNLECQVPVCLSPRNRVVHWVPFLSPPTTRRYSNPIASTRVIRAVVCSTTPLCIAICVAMLPVAKKRVASISQAPCKTLNALWSIDNPPHNLVLLILCWVIRVSLSLCRTVISEG